MLGRRKRLIEDISLFTDIVLSVILLIAVFVLLRLVHPVIEPYLREFFRYPLRIDGLAHLEEQSWLLFLIIFNLFAALRLTRFYEIDLFARWPRLALESAKGIGLGVGLTALFFYFFSISEVNRSLLMGFALLFWIYLTIKEWLLRRYLLDVHYSRKPLEAILVGDPAHFAERIAELNNPDKRSVRVRGLVLTDGDESDLPDNLRPLFRGQYGDLGDILAHGRYDLVFLGLHRGKVEIAQEVLNQAEEQGIEVWYFADFLTPTLARPEFDEYSGSPIIVFPTNRVLESQLLTKRIFDFCVSGAAILVLSPLFIAAALLIKLTSPGPVFFVQERTGWRCRTFRMIKFRTMYVDAEARRQEYLANNEMSGPVFKFTNDPRITKVGRYLRRFSIDELPQLFNVFKGDMSLVGPRPLPIYETEQFEAFKDRRRYSVPPGVTGLWQVSGRSEIQDFEEWIQLDLKYIDNWSFWLDLRILFQTVPAVFLASGAR